MTHRILLVDDNADNLSIYEYRLVFSLPRLLGSPVEVVCASDGSSAWRLTKDPPAFDLVITDLMMGGINGEELIDRIRSHGDGATPATVPIISMSAREEPASGATVHLVRPIDLSDLEQTIVGLLRLDPAAPKSEV